MHADRALDFPAPAEQRAEREMQLYCLRLDLDHLVERLDRLVRLLVEQEIEALEIRGRQRARFRHQIFDIDSRGEPAEREKQWQRKQPPVFNFHIAPYRDSVYPCYIDSAVTGATVLRVLLRISRFNASSSRRCLS